MKKSVEDIDAILIAGPTAGGKSALALSLAKRHGGVIINADSMQVYDTLKVLTARPGQDDMAGIDHRLYGHIPATQSYSAGQWLRDVEKQIGAIRAENRIPVFVGGTGLYFKALSGGLSDMPEIPAEIRNVYRQSLLDNGSDYLFSLLQERDPKAASKLNPADGQRIVRALEILHVTGRSIYDFSTRSGATLIDPDRARKIILLPERNLLHERINVRFSDMFDHGAIEEVQALLAQNPDPESSVMKAIGVREIALFLQGAISRDEVIARASAATRQYAKRQMTWFRNQMDLTWERIDPSHNAIT
jgi:tRNA dimethylallyltransferase